MMKAVFVIVLLLGLCYGEETISVNTKLGVINGKVVNVKFRDNEYANKQFFGIPYAKPPSGSLRFKKPEPVEKFESPFDALEFGRACPQNDLMNFGVASKNEDCLTLNIYVPTEPTNSPPGYAVMVFIHGGGFIFGSSYMVPGEKLSSYGNVIIVSINYRLGLFGFANTGDERAAGNLGLWDQRLALQWVSENIEAFGGDPSRVTIFGESAGSLSVYFQGMYPPNKGLFQNIIGQSGSPSLPCGYVSDNKPLLSFLAKKAGCEGEEFDPLFECLMNLDTERIMDVLAEIVTNSQEQMNAQFLPSLDGEYIKRDPVETMRMTKETKVDEIEFFRSLHVINGMNSAEGGMWLMMMFPGGAEDAVITDEDMVNTHIPSLLPYITMGKPMSDLLKAMLSYEYTDWSNPKDARHQFVKYAGDIFFVAPGVELSLVHANSTESNSWMYYFDASLDANVLPMPEWVKGANHGDDLMPVFGYSVEGYGELINKTDYVPPEWELDMSEKVMTLWSNFAKYSDPNGKDSHVWPKYTMDTQQHLTIGKENVVGQYLGIKELHFWREIFPSIIEAAEHQHSAESPFASKSSETCDANGNCG